MESDGYTINGGRVTRDPISDKKIKGSYIPYWNEICEMLRKCTELIKEVGFVGWDIAVCDNGPVLIEGNSNPLIAINEYAYLDKEFGHRDLLQEYLDEVVH